DRTASRQVDPAVVRRVRRGVVDLPGIFPMRAAAWIFLRRRHVEAPAAKPAIVSAHRPAALYLAVSPDRAARVVAAARRKQSGLAHSRLAHVVDRFAVCPT